MSEFIEEFYYGNIDPQARSTTEHLKATYQMEWVSRMNIIRNQASEIVSVNLIFEYPIKRRFFKKSQQNTDIHKQKSM